jgi:hypothetical protein
LSGKTVNKNPTQNVEASTTEASSMKDALTSKWDITTKDHSKEDDPQQSNDEENSEPEDKDDKPMNNLEEHATDSPTPHELVEINEEPESDEENPRGTQSVADKVRRRRSQRVEIPKSYQKEKSQKRKQESSSEFEPDVEDDVPDIVSPTIKRSRSKKAATNVPPAPLNNVSFHSKACVEKWKYVL